MKIPVPDYILSLKPYVPGKPLEELEREYGIENAVKLASNENPLGPSPRVADAIHAAVGKLNRYPDGSGYELHHRIAKKINKDANAIVLGNGSDEIIALLAYTPLRPDDEVINLALEDLQWPEYSKRQNYRHKGEEPEPTGATLLVTLHDKIVSIEKIEKDSVYVGRSHLCDIVINQRSISSKHFRIIQKNNAYFIEDMNSTNGTFLNEEFVEADQQLHHNDNIRIGWNNFIFIDENELDLEKTSEIKKSWIPGVYYTKK